MGYTTPPSFTTGDIVGASQLNVFRDDVRWANESSTANGRPSTFAYRSSNLSVANTTLVAVGFDQHEDNAGAHSTSVNNSRFTAPVAGRYILKAQARWAANATGHRAISVVPNGSGVPVSGQNSSAFGIYDLDNYCEAVVRLAAGDYLEVYAYQTSGGALNVLGHSVTYGGAFAYFDWIST
jgi:hypothetical protein